MNKIPDVPLQYKPVTDKATLDLMDIAERFWPIISELGESFECERNGIVVTIKGDSEMSKPTIEELEEILDKSDDYYKVGINPDGSICSHVVSGCPICGGKLALIRGKYPKDEQRNVCPTCLQEKFEQIKDMLSDNYGVGDAAKNND